MLMSDLVVNLTARGRESHNLALMTLPITFLYVPMRYLVLLKYYMVTLKRTILIIDFKLLVVLIRTHKGAHFLEKLNVKNLQFSKLLET